MRTILHFLGKDVTWVDLFRNVKDAVELVLHPLLDMKQLTFKVKKCPSLFVITWTI